MRYAVNHASAVFNPMAGLGNLAPARPRCAPGSYRGCIGKNEPIAASLLCAPPPCSALARSRPRSPTAPRCVADLKRPWCLFEAGVALRRRVLWCAVPAAFSSDGARREWRNGMDRQC